jgi:hypothetical protein
VGNKSHVYVYGTYVELLILETVIVIITDLEIAKTHGLLRTRLFIAHEWKDIMRLVCGYMQTNLTVS